MSSWWWLALPLMLLPVWWHRQRREKTLARALASARFLPRTEPLHRRAWRWRDRLLLLVRCLLLVFVTGWLADLILPWRADAVLVAAGTDPAWAEQQARQAGFGKADIMTLPTRDAFGWLLRHEREWQDDARILIVGDVPMPALRPRLSHPVQVRAGAQSAAPVPRHVAIVGPRAQQWRALFAALDGPHRYVVDAVPGPRTELIVWDQPEPPPPGLRSALWWTTEPRAFPELAAGSVWAGLRYADSARGRVWSGAGWPPRDADGARALFETWQRLHYPAPAYTTPSQQIAAAPDATPPPVDGALRYLLTVALMALFAIERALAHASGS